MPPVDEERAVMRPEQMVVSSSVRKVVAMSCFLAAKSLRWARMSWTVGVEVPDEAFFVGEGRVAFFLGLATGLVYPSSLLQPSSRSSPPIILTTSLRHRCFPGDTSGLAGE